MRTLGGTTTTQFASASAGPVIYFVQIDTSPVTRLNSSAHTIAYAGNDWLGTGGLGTVEEVADSAGEFKNLRFTLSGISAAYLSVALSLNLKSVACTVHVCVLDGTTHAVADVLQVWTGKMDQMPVALGNGTCTITAIAEHAGAAYARPKPLRYTDDDQQRLYPGDTCCRFVVSQSQKTDVWPAASFFRQ